MISFFPVVRLRPLGKQYELEKFNEITKDMCSVEKLIASVFCRFALDGKCPALFVKVPKRGDENLDGLIFLRDMNCEEIAELAYKMFDETVDFFGTNDVIYLDNEKDILLFMKKDFSDGKWENYGYETSGMDGISIPS